MAGSEASTSNGLMPVLTIILLLSLVGAGIGFAVGVFLQPGTQLGMAQAQPGADAGGKTPSEEGTAGEDAHAGDHQAVQTPEEEPLVEAGLKIIPLPPVVTTLAAPEGKWIRLEGSILADPAASGGPELLAERAGEQILAYLRTVKLAQLQGPSGFLALRDDLNETVRSLSDGEVHAILIHGLLIE